MSLQIPGLSPEWDGLKVLQFSDLHFNRQVNEGFLRRLSERIFKLAPDLIVFTGDFLCYSALHDADRLSGFLRGLNAPLGCYTIFGNHDYTSYVTINKAGEYDVIDNAPMEVLKGIRRVFSKMNVRGSMAPHFPNLQPSEALVELLDTTPFTILENETIQLRRDAATLNVCGLGEYMANRFLPEIAFQNYDRDHPGIVLAHNPDCIPHLAHSPGEVLLCGHVHGGQVNLPWVRERFIVMENPQYVKGLFHIDGRWAYINRGLGGTLRFRCFSAPELTCITLRTPSP